MGGWSSQVNQQLLSKFGYNGPVGQGQGDAFLAANPQYIDAYTTARKQIQPGYSYKPQPVSPYAGGVSPVGYVEPFNQVQKDALSAYANMDYRPYQNRADNYFTSIADLYGGVNPQIQQATAPLSQAQITQYSNPYQQTVINNVLQDLQRQGDVARNQINANKAGQRSFGDSSSAIQNAELERNLLNTSANTSATLNAQGYDTAVNNINTDKNRQLQGVSSLLNLINTGSALGSQQKGYADQTLANKLMAGNAIQNQNQKLLDVVSPQINQANNYDLTQLSTLLSFLNQFPTNSLSTGRSYDNGQGYLGQLTNSAGGALHALSGIGAAFSDYRIKHNVTFKEIENGFNVYEFSYIGSDKRFSGVMAQEVEQVMPEAVYNINGIKAVNYSMINVPFHEVTVWDS